MNTEQWEDEHQKLRLSPREKTKYKKILAQWTELGHSMDLTVRQCGNPLLIGSENYMPALRQMATKVGRDGNKQDQRNFVKIFRQIIQFRNDITNTPPN